MTLSMFPCLVSCFNPDSGTFEIRVENARRANRSLFLPVQRQEEKSGIARSLFVDAYRRSGEEELFNRISECGTAGPHEKRLTKRVR
jgi:hypothetical protein